MVLGSQTPHFCHLAWSVDLTLCYVNKEYNLGILKGIILFLTCLQSFQFPISDENKGVHTVLFFDILCECWHHWAHFFFSAKCYEIWLLCIKLHRPIKWAYRRWGSGNKHPSTFPDWDNVQSEGVVKSHLVILLVTLWALSTPLFEYDFIAAGSCMWLIMQPNDITIYLHAWKFYFHIVIDHFDQFFSLSSLLFSSFIPEVFLSVISY